MEQINIDRLLGIGGLAVGVIGIIIAIAVPLYFYRKGLRPKLLSVAYNGPFRLMLSIPGVTVSYLGSQRTALSRTNILFGIGEHLLLRRAILSRRSLLQMQK